MRSLLRLDDGNPIQVEESKRVVSTCRALEGWLEDHLTDAVETPQSRGSEVEVARSLPAFQYCPKQDAGWLGCRRPQRSTESLLGILEDLPGANDDIDISINIFSGKQARAASLEVEDAGQDKNGDESGHCFSVAPHNSWERTELDPLSTLSDNQSLQEIDWVDLRGVDFGELSSAGSTHMLRSILGSDHRASPWSHSDHACVTNASTAILVLDSLPEELLDLRVNDACPSWYMFGFGRFEFPLNGGIDLLTTEADVSSRKPCLVLIYRVLSPRDQFSRVNPETNEPATIGCLWETITVLPPEGCEGEPHEEHRMVSPPYISSKEYGSLLDRLFQQSVVHIIEQEARTIANWTEWPESQHYQSKTDGGPAPWNVFPLCHCFPATDVAARKWIPRTCDLVPQTVQYLREILGDTLRTALFSRLDPNSVLEAHTGWKDLANHVIRLHLPLVVPSGGLCGTWVDGCVETHERGRPLLFDDSKTHRAYNFSSEDRIVLILDLVRPDALPHGTATGGHSEELDKFIQQMGI